jgi:hypothetical protein
MCSSLNKKEQKEFQAESETYYCNICDFNTSRKFNYDKHCSTRKHLLNNLKQSLNNFKQKGVDEADFSCKKCNKVYKNRSGLWHHNKKCILSQKSGDAETLLSDASFNPECLMNANVIYELIKQNNEFKTLLIEQNNKIMELAKDKSLTINNNNTTNNNQSFNMNFFLNEQCKDALDIMDFVNSLQFSLSDLENTGKVGYVKGISDIFLRGLRELDVYKRPIHCSDLKREVMYVKDNDVWEKDEDNKKVKKAIQRIGGMNFKQVKEWIDVNPDSRDVKTKKHEQYVNILTKCTGGADSQEDDIMFNKIISNVAKEVTIDK